MAEIKTQEFFSASQVSIQDPVLRQALIRVGTGFDSSRLEAIKDVTPEVWEEWKEQARQIKVHTLDHLDYYLDLLEQNVAKAGGQVHFAADAAQANAIVAHLAESRGVKIATKSSRAGWLMIQAYPAAKSPALLAAASGMRNGW